jgi:hypothetical protein
VKNIQPRPILFTFFVKGGQIWSDHPLIAIAPRSSQLYAMSGRASSLQDSGEIVGYANPTLKRGANNHCTYGTRRMAD